MSNILKPAGLKPRSRTSQKEPKAKGDGFKIDWQSRPEGFKPASDGSSGSAQVPWDTLGKYANDLMDIFNSKWLSFVVDGNSMKPYVVNVRDTTDRVYDSITQKKEGGEYFDDKYGMLLETAVGDLPMEDVKDRLFKRINSLIGRPAKELHRAFRVVTGNTFRSVDLDKTCKMMVEFFTKNADGTRKRAPSGVSMAKMPEYVRMLTESAEVARALLGNSYTIDTDEIHAGAGDEGEDDDMEAE